MSSFLDSTGLSRLVSKITDYFAKKDGTYPDMTVGNVSNVVPIEKLPTASSVTSGDTTHVPTADAVYKHLNSFIARGVGNVAVVYKPLTEVWDENHRGLFKLQYAVSNYFGEYFIEIQCKGTITSSNPLGDGGFARVYSNFSTNLGSSILKYAIVDNYVVFGFSVSNADRYMCLEVCGHSVSVAAIKELSGYTFTAIVVSDAFWSVKSKAEDAPVGSASIPVYVKSDGSVEACTDVASKSGSYPNMTVGMASHLIPITSLQGTNISASRRYALIAEKRYSSDSRPGEMFRLFVYDCYVDFKTFGSIDVSNQSAAINVCPTLSFSLDESTVYRFLKITWFWDSSSSSIYVRIYVDFNTLSNKWVSLFQFAGQSGKNYGETWTPYTGYDNIFASSIVGYEVIYQWDRAYLFGGAVYAQKIGQYNSTTRIGSPSIPVYVKSDGSVAECTDIGKEFWIEGTGGSAMYKTIGSIEFNDNGYFSQLCMEIGPLGTTWSADSQASKIIVKLSCYGSNYKLNVLAINYSDITSRCSFDTYKANNRVYIVVKIVTYGAGAYTKVISHGERSWTAGVSYSAGTAPATLDGGTHVTYKYAKINTTP